MKKGIVKSLALSHKNGKGILRAGDKVSERDVNDFDKLVKAGHIELPEAKADEDSVDLSKLKKDELQDKCSELGIEFAENETKADLIKKIEEAA